MSAHDWSRIDCEPQCIWYDFNSWFDFVCILYISRKRTNLWFKLNTKEPDWTLWSTCLSQYLTVAFKRQIWSSRSSRLNRSFFEYVEQNTICVNQIISKHHRKHSLAFSFDSRQSLSSLINKMSIGESERMSIFKSGIP